MLEQLLHAAIHKLAEKGLEKLTDNSTKTTPLDEKISLMKSMSPVCTYFYGCLYDWLGLQVPDDCVTYHHKRYSKGKTERLGDFTKTFKINEAELIMFTRDTSFLSTCDQGVVITNRAIYIIEDKSVPNKRLVVKWNSIEKVLWSGVFKIYGKDGEVICKLKKKDLFKLEPNDDICSELACHLTGMALCAGEDTEEEKAADKKMEETESRKAQILADCQKAVLLCSGNKNATLETKKRDCDLDCSAVSALLVKWGYPKISVFDIKFVASWEPVSFTAKMIYEWICKKEGLNV